MNKTEQKILTPSIKIKQTTKKFRALFLLKFTEEMIKHSETGEIYKLKNILKEREKRLAQTIKQKIKTPKIKQELSRENLKELEEVSPSILKQPPRSPFYPRNIPAGVLPKQTRILRIPEQKLPPNLQYLRPTPTEKTIDLNKLNPLIQDRIVRLIECNGPDKNIIVSGSMGVKKTNIILSKDEIGNIIKKFSETAKIPIHEGIFRVAVGKLILTAIISEVIGSKFIIKKIVYNPYPILRR